MLLQLTLALCCQYTFPTPLPQYDPAGYQLRYAGFGYVAGPFAPPVGNPRVINLHPIGTVLSVDTTKRLFTVQYPGYRSTYHYGDGTMFLGSGQLAVGRRVFCDPGSYTVEMQ